MLTPIELYKELQFGYGRVKGKMAPRLWIPTPIKTSLWDDIILAVIGKPIQKLNFCFVNTIPTPLLLLHDLEKWIGEDVSMTTVKMINVARTDMHVLRLLAIINTPVA
jgi:hypothetical protein